MFYAVAKGRTVGIFKTWEACKAQVDSYEGAIFKKFKTEKEAQTFVAGNGSTILGQLGVFGVEVKRAPTPSSSEMENSNSIVCFSDGSCINNGSTSIKKPANAGYACVFPNHPQYTQARKLCATPDCAVTNNRAEYTALICAIEICRDIDSSSHSQSLAFYTDSKLLIDTATRWIPVWKQKGWRKADGKKVLNLDLVVKIDELLRERKVTFKHVRAHTGGVDWMSKWNDKADELAKAAALGSEYP
jgi:ribonuclease HI